MKASEILSAICIGSIWTFTFMMLSSILLVCGFTILENLNSLLNIELVLVMLSVSAYVVYIIKQKFLALCIREWKLVKSQFFR